MIQSEDEEDDDIQIIEPIELDPAKAKVKIKAKQKSTMMAEREERERVKRLAERQKQFNGIELNLDVPDLDTALSKSQIFKNGKTYSILGQSFTPQAVKSITLDNSSEFPVKVHPSIVKNLKPHQAQGIEFMWNTTFESLARLNEEGSGGILAHCMVS
jgi:transcriptional regulator ATRX